MRPERPRCLTIDACPTTTRPPATTPDAEPEPSDDDSARPAAGPAELPDQPPRVAKGLRVGYRADEVDEFLAELWRALDRTTPGWRRTRSPTQRFKATRLRRRYQMRSVDDYLERVQAVLRERHGEDAVADVEGHARRRRATSRPRWIYLVALVLVVAMLAFAVHPDLGATAGCRTSLRHVARRAGGPRRERRRDGVGVERRVGSFGASTPSTVTETARTPRGGELPVEAAHEVAHARPSARRARPPPGRGQSAARCRWR